MRSDQTERAVTVKFLPATRARDTERGNQSAGFTDQRSQKMASANRHQDTSSCSLYLGNLADQEPDRVPDLV